MLEVTLVFGTWLAVVVVCWLREGRVETIHTRVAGKLAAPKVLAGKPYAVNGLALGTAKVAFRLVGGMFRVVRGVVGVALVAALVR